MDNNKEKKNDYLDLESNINNITEFAFDEQEISSNLPVLPTFKSILFPVVFTQITLTRTKVLEMIKYLDGNSKLVGIVTQKDPNTKEPQYNDIYQYGTIAKILKIINLPDGSSGVVLRGIKKFRTISQADISPYLTVNVEFIDDVEPDENDSEFKSLIQKIRELANSYLSNLKVDDNISQSILNMPDPVFFVNFLCTNVNFSIKDKLALLEKVNVKDRAIQLLSLLELEMEKMKFKNDFHQRVQKRLDDNHKEYILNQQLEEIQKELGDSTHDDFNRLLKIASKKKWNKKISDIFNEELSKLKRLHTMAPEYGIQLAYLQLIVDLPWDSVTKDNYDLKRAKKILDKDHYGLEKVKERILEFLAVLKLKGNLKSPIICLYGPPGIGKTSLGKSVARALNRKYARMSLGGIHDESEIRGHRKTYIGAMPGRIIQSLKKVKSSNPVFVLDEIDKVGADFRGDPSAALLEVLDPEQNSEFHDNYLDIDYNLSNILFIATANNLSSISPALLDRMEIIDMTGYLLEEKIEIAKQHLIPNQLSAHGVRKNQARFSDEVIKFIIENYTRESGVRTLNKNIASIIRKVAKSIALGEKKSSNLTTEQVEKFLGSKKYLRRKYEKSMVAGVVTGLAWTSVGGEIMTIEAVATRGSGKISMTGNLGKVMIESATIAFEYLKSHYKELKIHPLIFDSWNVHIHAPEGAIPKDGPSAGITIVTALASLFTQRKILPFTAMTGEITLSGNVLPVGGIKEKILAAKRAGIKNLILSELNKSDIDEINEIYRKGLVINYVKTMSEVLDIVLLKEKVEKPMLIGVPKSKLPKQN